MPDDLLNLRHSQWFKGVLDLCVLGLLSGGERYGYEVARLLEDHGFGRIKGGTLYPLLARLENEALVNARWKPSELGPERKYYVVTEKGRKLLRETAPSWRTFSERVLRVMGEGR